MKHEWVRAPGSYGGDRESVACRRCGAVVSVMMSDAARYHVRTLRILARKMRQADCPGPDATAKAMEES
jgi:hypothetical protein